MFICQCLLLFVSYLILSVKQMKAITLNDDSVSSALFTQEFNYSLWIYFQLMFSEDKQTSDLMSSSLEQIWSKLN